MIFVKVPNVALTYCNVVAGPRLPGLNVASVAVVNLSFHVPPRLGEFWSPLPSTPGVAKTYVNDVIFDKVRLNKKIEENSSSSRL